MSGVEIIGLAASVIQLADVGLKLSVKLFTFTRKIKSADQGIDALSREIAATGAVLQQLGSTLSEKGCRQICSKEAIATAQGLIDDCEKVFKRLGNAVGSNDPGKKGKVSLMQRLNFTFLESQIEESRANLERLKSSLLVILNVLILAEQVRNRETLPSLQDTQQLLETLVLENAANEKRCNAILKAIEDGNSKPVTTMPPPVYNLATVTAIAPQCKIAKPSDLPRGLEPHYERIIDHVQLVTDLLKQVASADYKIDHEDRSGLHKGILDIHWNAWSAVRDVFGSQMLEKMLSGYEDVAKHWSKRSWSMPEDHDSKNNTLSKALKKRRGREAKRRDIIRAEVGTFFDETSLTINPMNGGFADSNGPPELSKVMITQDLRERSRSQSPSLRGYRSTFTDQPFAKTRESVVGTGDPKTLDKGKLDLNLRPDIGKIDKDIPSIDEYVTRKPPLVAAPASDAVSVDSSWNNNPRSELLSPSRQSFTLHGMQSNMARQASTESLPLSVKHKGKSTYKDRSKREHALARRRIIPCVRCRHLKVLCDEGRPKCSSCKVVDSACTYTSPLRLIQEPQTASVDSEMTTTAGSEESLNTVGRTARPETGGMKGFRQGVKDSIPHHKDRDICLPKYEVAVVPNDSPEHQDQSLGKADRRSVSDGAEGRKPLELTPEYEQHGFARKYSKSAEPADNQTQSEWTPKDIATRTWKVTGVARKYDKSSLTDGQHPSDLFGRDGSANVTEQPQGEVDGDTKAQLERDLVVLDKDINDLSVGVEWYWKEPKPSKKSSSKKKKKNKTLEATSPTGDQKSIEAESRDSKDEDRKEVTGNPQTHLQCPSAEQALHDLRNRLREIQKEIQQQALNDPSTTEIEPILVRDAAPSSDGKYDRPVNVEPRVEWSKAGLTTGTTDAGDNESPRPIPKSDVKLTQPADTDIWQNFSSGKYKRNHHTPMGDDVRGFKYQVNAVEKYFPSSQTLTQRPDEAAPTCSHVPPIINIHSPLGSSIPDFIVPEDDDIPSAPPIPNPETDESSINSGGLSAPTVFGGNIRTLMSRFSTLTKDELGVFVS